MDSKVYIRFFIQRIQFVFVLLLFDIVRVFFIVLQTVSRNLFFFVTISIYCIHLNISFFSSLCFTFIIVLYTLSKGNSSLFLWTRIACSYERVYVLYIYCRFDSYASRDKVHHRAARDTTCPLLYPYKRISYRNGRSAFANVYVCMCVRGL